MGGGGGGGGVGWFGVVGWDLVLNYYIKIDKEGFLLGFID
jgi:hypothetical protein